MSTQQTIDLAIQHHRAGELGQAEAMYRRVLEVQPDQADALHIAPLNNLGNILLSQGRFAEAIDCYRRAVVINPEIARSHFNLANALGRFGRVDGAIESYRAAIGIDPRMAIAHYNLGVLL